MGRAEIGASYDFKIKESDGLTASLKNTVNIILGGRVDYELNSGMSLFARIVVAHSLRNNL